MKGLLARLFRTVDRASKKRWEREERARRLGLFSASPTEIVNGVVLIGVDGVDNMRSEHLGAPNSPYYEDQSANEFDKAYKKIQKKTESLIARSAK